MTLPVVSFATGLLFSAGLVISGMTTPSKVTGFLDVTGGWDPSLALVMVGAIIVHAIAFRLITRRESPLLDTKFAIPTRSDVDTPLVIGAAIFGIGWALGGVCPGPGIVSAASGAGEGLVFLVSMFAGMSAFRIYESAKVKT